MADTLQRGRLYDQAQAFADRLAARDQAAELALLQSWSDSYWGVRREMDQFLAKVAAARAAGTKASPAWAFQERRLQTVMDQTRTEMARYADQASLVTDARQRQAIREGMADAETLADTVVRDGLPGLDVDLARINPSVLEAGAGFLADGSVLRNHLAATLPDSAAQSIRDALIQGLSRGKSQDWMTRQATRALGLSHTRAVTILRTESLRAYRAASRATYQANADVLEGWTWHAHLDARTCVACVVMDGTLHPHDSTLDGHPRCRCAMVPRTRSWEELGLEGLEDSRPPVRSGKEWLEAQSEMTQRAIIGRAKFTAWKEGHITLDDLVARTHSDTWGTMRTERSLKAILEGRDPNRMDAFLPDSPVSVEPPAVPTDDPFPAPPQSVLDAMTPPRGGWTTQTRAKTLKALDATPEGKMLHKSLLAFQQGGSTAIPRLRADIAHMLGGTGDLAPGRVETLRNLLSAVRHYDAGDRDLFRGMQIPGGVDDVLASYRPGDDLDLLLASFSSDKKAAQGFSRASAGQKVTRKNVTPVVIEWTGDAKRALPIQNLAKSNTIATEREWLGSGKYRILEAKKVRRDGVETVVVKVEQIDSTPSLPRQADLDTPDAAPPADAPALAPEPTVLVRPAFPEGKIPRSKFPESEMRRLWPQLESLEDLQVVQNAVNQKDAGARWLFRQEWKYRREVAIPTPDNLTPRLTRWTDDVDGSGVLDPDSRTWREQINAVQDGRWNDGKQWQVNCTNTTSSWELRRRGLNATAAPRPTLRGRDWSETGRLWNADPDEWMEDRTPLQAVKWIQGLPEGARGAISVKWNGGGAHIFSWEVKDGKAIWSDAQPPPSWGNSGEDLLGYLQKRVTGKVQVFRMDNLPITDDLATFLREG